MYYQANLVTRKASKIEGSRRHAKWSTEGQSQSCCIGWITDPIHPNTSSSAIFIYICICFYFHQPKNFTGTYRRLSLTCVWRLTSVPDQDTSIIRGAGKHVVIDRTDRQTVHGVDVQEHIQSFSSAGTTIIHPSCETFCERKHKHEATQDFYQGDGSSISYYFTHLSTSWRITCSSFPEKQQTDKLWIIKGRCTGLLFCSDLWSQCWNEWLVWTWGGGGREEVGLVKDAAWCNTQVYLHYCEGETSTRNLSILTAWQCRSTCSGDNFTNISAIFVSLVKALYRRLVFSQTAWMSTYWRIIPDVWNSKCFDFTPSLLDLHCSKTASLNAALLQKKQGADVVHVALTAREDPFVGAIKGQAEDVGQVLSLQLHRFGPSMDGFLHVPQKHPAVIAPCGRNKTDWRGCFQTFFCLTSHVRLFNLNLS